jgi:hypothetical protein
MERREKTRRKGERRRVSSQTTLIELCQKLRDNEFSWPRRGKLGGWKNGTPAPALVGCMAFLVGPIKQDLTKKIKNFYIFVARCTYKSSVKRLGLECSRIKKTH